MKPTNILLLVALLLVGAMTAGAEEPAAFHELLSRYEAIRLTLVADETAEVQDNASAIAVWAEKLLDEFDAQAAGVPEAESEAGKAILREIAAAAANVAAAADIEAVREVFFDLSKPMGRYRKLTGDTTTIVVYCPMAKKAWLQPDGEVGNPYYGQAMPTCGNRIPDE